MGPKRWILVAFCAALGAGASIAASSCGDDGRVDVQGGTTGSTTVTVDTTATDPAALQEAMDEVAEYARKQTAALVRTTKDLRAAIDDGEEAAAQKAYAASRPYYERIEPLVALFPEIDGKIDGRDPATTGFHAIERKLWKDEEIDARTKVLAAGLVKDSVRLDELMQDAKVTPEVVIPGVAELVDEVEESKITGEEERYSKLDIPTFVANLDGAKAFYETLEPLVEEADPELNERIEAAFDDAYEQVEGLEGKAYDDLSDAQKKEIKQSIEALAEPLARVQGTLGVKS